jgi:single-strand DNA-binding protein
MSLNKVMLIGNVGKEPEVRYIEEGVATAVVNLATNTNGYTLPNGTVVPERTEWHRVLLWRKQAEFVEKYVHTGDKLYVEGELRTRSYTDKQGRTHNITEIWANTIEILSSKPKPQTQETTAPAAPETCPF